MELSRRITVKTQEKDIFLKRIADDIISPVLISFVWWVLYCADKKGLKKLYFLSRDGYIMYKIASYFCEYFNIGTECRYLYGSRIAWRIAVYNLISEDEKYKYIFSSGYKITPRIILKRVQFDKEQRFKIYRDIDFYADENQELKAKDLKLFEKKLKSSRLFAEYLHYMSEKQLKDVSGYLNQEGLFDGGDIAIIDSGWTGTIQRNLRQIAEYNMANPKITGYYFGLYTHSADIKDGEYNAWYFSPDSRINLMTEFNNNVFECMCATPFDMTCAYSYENGRFVPKFITADSFNKEKAGILNLYIETYVSDFFKNNKLIFDDYSDKYLSRSRIILQRFMIHPSEEEARSFGDFRFCDDVSECYGSELAKSIDGNYLKCYNIFMRFIYKFKAGSNNTDLFWFHGSAALSGINKKIDWYKLNYRIWESLRLAVIKYKLKLKRDKNADGY